MTWFFPEIASFSRGIDDCVMSFGRLPAFVGALCAIVCVARPYC